MLCFITFSYIHKFITYSGLIISGSRFSESVGKSAEVFVPSTGQHCQLPDLPGAAREFHTMEKMTVCGGEKSTTSCLTLTGGTWGTTISLLEER